MKNQTWMTLVVVWSACVFAADSPVLIENPEARKAFYRQIAKAELAEAAEQFEIARDAYREAIRLAPDQIGAHHGYQDAMARLGHEGEVLDQYRDKLKRQGANAQAHYLLGRVAKDLAEKERLFRRALELDPTLKWAAYGLGYLYERLGEWDKSDAAFKQAIAIDPDWAEAHHGLGFCYMGQGKDDLAAAQFEKALALNPRYVDSLVNLSLIALRSRDTKRAAEFCQRALEVEADHPEALNNLGKAYYQEGRTRAAIRAFERSLRTGRAGAPEVVYLNLGFCHARLGEHDRAAAAFLKAIELNSGFGYAYYCLSNIRRLQGRLDAAQELVEKAQEHGYEVPAHYRDRLRREADGG